MSTANNNVDKLRSNGKLMPYFIKCNVISSQSGNLTSELNSVQPFGEKDEIVSLVRKGDKHISSVTSWCNSISQYFSKKEYENDIDFSKYPPMRDSLILSIENARETSIKGINSRQ